jgi:hypothetical protein
MPAFSRTNDAWAQTTPRSRTADAWGDDDDQLFVRDGDEWVLIHPDPADAGPLLPVENLAVSDGPTHNSVSIEWTNPPQPSIEPTEVQVRLANETAIWTVYPYPTTDVSWGALNDDFEYLAQVRLVRRVDGEVTDLSSVESLGFTTEAAPIGEPAPDPGGTDGDTIFPINIPIGNPGTVGSDDCWFRWELFILNQDTLAWTTTGIDGEEDGTITSFSYDLATLDPTRVYRFEFTEVCNGVDGDTTIGGPFVGLGDWGATCGGITGSASSGFTAVADAIWGFPEMCTVDDGERQALVDSVTGVEISEGAAFGLAYHDPDGEWVVLADGDGGPVLLVPSADVETALVAGADHSIAFDIRADGAWTPTNGAVRALEVYGFNHAIQLVETATGWKIRVRYLTSSGFFTLDSAEIPTDTAWHSVAVTWDDSGTKLIYIDGNVSATGGNGVQLAGAVTPTIVSSLPPNWTTRKHYGWDRVIIAEEVASVYQQVPPDSDFSWLIDAISAGSDTAPNLGSGATTSTAFTSDYTASPEPHWSMGPTYEPITGCVKADSDIATVATELTVCVLINPTTLDTNTRRCISTGGGDGDGTAPGWYIALRTADAFFGIEQAGGTAPYRTNAALAGSFSTGTLYCIVGRHFADHTFKITVNGVHSAAASLATDGAPSQAGICQIAGLVGFAGSTHLPAKYHRLGILQRALSDIEVDALTTKWLADYS